MPVLKCKMCGGDIELSPDKTFGVCDSCGSAITFPKIDDEQRAAAFNRGNHFRRSGEFDKALTVYEHIVQEDETDAEAHWCCALCRFGIEYVEDPSTFEYIPTCHRASFDSFLNDADYLSALELSDGITKKQYMKDAAKIAEVQKGILATSQNEEPFDVFICYKELDENGQRTRDSIMAQDIYYQLTEQGRRVFFARVTLEDKAGTEYEPYIFAALNSAKVMIVVTTSADNVNAVWVKNEWSRFLALMRKDRSKLLLPCFKDMDPYDLPEQLSVLQSYDMSKIGFIQDLIRGVNKVLDADVKPEIKVSNVKETKTVNTNINQPNVEPLLKRAFLFLEDGDWKNADDYSERVLDQDPENARAYLIKLMIDLHVNKKEELKNCNKVFDDNNNYIKVKRFADDTLKNELDEYVKFIKGKEEEKRIATEKAKQKRIKIAKIIIPIVIAAIALFVLLTKVVIPNVKYNKAVALYGKELVDNFYNAEIGDTVIFGSYEQDDNAANGMEKIEWQVLDKTGNKILLISKYALDTMPYNKNRTNTTWEECTLRTWLNGTFYNSAFTDEERAVIQKNEVTADKNPEYSTNPGNDTEDNVFLLSVNDANKYFKNKESMMCEPTSYAKAQGVYVYEKYGTTWWWLRSPGDGSNFATGVSTYGAVLADGNRVDRSDRGIRPALWINFEQ